MNDGGASEQKHSLQIVITEDAHSYSWSYFLMVLLSGITGISIMIILLYSVMNGLGEPAHTERNALIFLAACMIGFGIAAFHAFIKMLKNLREARPGYSYEKTDKNAGRTLPSQKYVRLSAIILATACFGMMLVSISYFLYLVLNRSLENVKPDTVVWTIAAVFSVMFIGMYLGALTSNLLRYVRLLITIEDMRVDYLDNREIHDPAAEVQPELGSDSKPHPQTDESSAGENASETLSSDYNNTDTGAHSNTDNSDEITEHGDKSTDSPSTK